VLSDQRRRTHDLLYDASHIHRVKMLILIIMLAMANIIGINDH